MRVHLIRKQTIQNYVVDHASGKSAFENWVNKVKYADWESPEAIRQTFKSADILGQGSHRVVFNIDGNKYRMICKYFFGAARLHLFVCWIGTHAEYNELCNLGRQFGVNNY